MEAEKRTALFPDGGTGNLPGKLTAPVPYGKTGCLHSRNAAARSGRHAIQGHISPNSRKDRQTACPFFLYKENHSLGEWFKRRLLPIMRTRKTPFARIEVRSGNCTKKQREVTQNERQ